MKILLKAAVLAAAFVVGGAAAAWADTFDPSELNHITIANKTGHEIEYVFFSPADSEEWGADVLGSTNTLADGDSRAFYIHYPDSSDKFDFLVIDDQGTSYDLFDQVVQDGKESTITFTPKTAKPDAPALDLANVKVTNKSGEELYYLFVSPADSKMWGLDVLDDQTTLTDGSEYELLVPVTDKPVRYDLLAVTEKGDTYQFTMKLSSSASEYSFDITPGDRQ